MAIQKVVSIVAVACALSAAAGPVPGTPPAAAPAVEPKDACKQGRSLYAAGDVLKAAKVLSHCVEQEPRNREAWAALANADLEAGRFAPAADAFARAEALRPDPPITTSMMSDIVRNALNAIE